MVFEGGLLHMDHLSPYPEHLSGHQDEYRALPMPHRPAEKILVNRTEGTKMNLS